MLSHHRHHHARGARGFTLLEVVVALAILSIIIVPLAMALSSSLQVTDEVGAELTAATSRDQLASQLTRDVESVDAAGVSINGTFACTIAGQDAADTLLVSFNATDAGGTITRASYWVTDSGRDTSLVRRACDDVEYGQGASNGAESVVLQRVGTPGSTDAHLDVIHGPGTRRNPCDEISCTIEVDGRSQYQVTAQRRVFGAGVPLEVGRLYSSTANRFIHYDNSGTSLGQENTWPGTLSLPPGLDGDGQLTVRFRVQQRFDTGGAAVAGGQARYYDGTAFTSTDAETWVDATYSDATGIWKIELPMTKLNRAGEYRVWTQLEPVDDDIKEYGGTDPSAGGFPLWVDWKIVDSVFVSPNGLDTNSGLTPSVPVKTLAKGLQVAASATTPRPEVVVQAGTYPGTVTVAGAGFANNRTVTGGHADDVTTGTPANDSWRRGAPSSTGANSVQVSGTNGTGVLVQAKTGQRFRQLDIESGDTTQLSRYGMRVIASGSVILDQVQVQARAGLTGTPGADGAMGGSGCGGTQGKRTTSTSNTTWEAPPSGYTAAPCNFAQPDPLRTGGVGGGGGASGDGADAGGKGAPSSGSAGAGGSAGSQGCPSSDGQIGQGNGTGGGQPVNGRPRGDGGRGGGKNGLAPTVGATWTGAPGQDGILGSDGGGGGGGGGGGRRQGFFCGSRNGGQGASGGWGGQGGVGGTAGTAGGGSFALYLNASTADVKNARLIAGAGGAGGNGGKGGDGGFGGRGGPALDNDGAGNAGAAGGGGGGNGGGAGGGGQGGPSVSVYSDTAAGFTSDATVTLQRGASGATGKRGDPAVAQRSKGGQGGRGGDGFNLSFPLNFFFPDAQNGSNGGVGVPGIEAGAEGDGTAVPSCKTNLGGTCAP